MAGRITTNPHEHCSNRHGSTYGEKESRLECRSALTWEESIVQQL